MKDAKAVMEEVKRMKKESKLKKKFLKLENKRNHLGNETAPWHVVDCCIVLWCIYVHIEVRTVFSKDRITDKPYLFEEKIAKEAEETYQRKGGAG